MRTFSRFAQIASVSVLLLAAGCTSKPEAVSTAPPPMAPPAATPAPRPLPPPQAPVARGPLPGSAEDFRVNVGDTVHFAYDQ